MPEGLDYPSAAIDGEQGGSAIEKRALLTQTIRSLPAMDRQLVLLHLEGLNYAQIEEISGTSIGDRFAIEPAPGQAARAAPSRRKEQRWTLRTN